MFVVMKMPAVQANYYYGYLARTYSKPLNAIVCREEQPYLKLAKYEEINDFMSFIGSYMIAVIQMNNISQRAFERLCREQGYHFSIRSIKGLIRKDRSNFRLSYFAVPFALLGISWKEVFMAYTDYLSGEERQIA